MMRSKTTESLVSALVILLVTLLLFLARATAYGYSTTSSALTGVTTTDVDPTGPQRTVCRVASDGEYLP